MIQLSSMLKSIVSRVTLEKTGNLNGSSVTTASKDQGSMTGLTRMLDRQGIAGRFRLEGNRMLLEGSGKTLAPPDLKIEAVARFEGDSDPSYMEILYVLATNSGEKGILVDAFGLAADEKIGAFIEQIEDHRVSGLEMNELEVEGLTKQEKYKEHDHAKMRQVRQ